MKKSVDVVAGTWFSGEQVAAKEVVMRDRLNYNRCALLLPLILTLVYLRTLSPSTMHAVNLAHTVWESLTCIVDKFGFHEIVIDIPRIEILGTEVFNDRKNCFPKLLVDRRASESNHVIDLVRRY